MTTPFIEANAILAMQQGDLSTARACVASLLPNERKQLAAAATNLAEFCFPETCDICSDVPLCAQIHYHWVCSPRRVKL
jgi:hypothetical protein